MYLYGYIMVTGFSLLVWNFVIFLKKLLPIGFQFCDVVKVVIIIIIIIIIKKNI
jgi:hypothetical protein